MLTQENLSETASDFSKPKPTNPKPTQTYAHNMLSDSPALVLQTYIDVLQPLGDSI